MLAGDELSEVAALLLVRAVAADLIDAEVRVGAIREPDRGGGARDFLHGNAVLEITEPCPTPFLLDRDAVHAELAQLGPEIAREQIAAVDLIGARGNAFSGKTAHALAQHVGRLAQAEIKAANVVHAHGADLACRQPAQAAIDLLVLINARPSSHKQYCALRPVCALDRRGSSAVLPLCKARCETRITRRPPSAPCNLRAQYRCRRSTQSKGISMSPKSQDIKQLGLFGFLAQPDAPTKSGVVVLPTIFGVNAFVRGYAEMLARAGLAAAVWDPYEGLRLITDYEESKTRSRSLSDSGMQSNVKKWVDYMENDLTLTSIGVLGFCLGGRYALIAAAQERRIKACAAAYPSIENPRLSNQQHDAVALAADIRCPVQVLQPGHDHVATVETYAALRETLHKRAAPTIWQYHPDAEHGFMHRKEPAANPAATVIASPQLVAFLTACLS